LGWGFVLGLGFRFSFDFFLFGVHPNRDLGFGFLFDSVHLIYLILFFLFYLYRIILFPSSSRVRVRVLFSVPFSFPLLFFWILFWIFFSDLNGGLFFPRAVVVVTRSSVTPPPVSFQFSFTRLGLGFDSLESLFFFPSECFVGLGFGFDSLQGRIPLLLFFPSPS